MNDTPDSAETPRKSFSRQLLSDGCRRYLKYYVTALTIVPRLRTIGGKPFTDTRLTFSNGETRTFRHRRTIADIGVIWEHFVSEDYSLGRLARCNELMDRYRAIIDSGRTPLIVDAGSNIGASVLFFARAYPEAKIVAFEPDDKNFELLEQNTAGLKAELHKAAIGPETGRATLVDNGLGAWAYQTKMDPAGQLEMVSLRGLIETRKGEGFVPFLVKVDIEGGEDHLFDEPNEWFDEIPVVIVELHDSLLPKMQTSQSFLRCVTKYGRDFISIGANVFSLKTAL